MTPERRCDVENVQDFARYYYGSWIGWNPSDAAFTIPVAVGQGIGNQGVYGRLMTRNPEGRCSIGEYTVLLWADIQKCADFGIPPIGMIQDGPTFIFGSYSTPRHARKGLRPGEVRITGFNGWNIRKKYPSSSQILGKNETIWNIFNPEYCTLEQAEAKLQAGEAVGVPLSRTLGIYTLPKFRTSLLAYKRWTIGHVENPFEIHIKKEYADYEGEISRQTGAEVIVR